MKAPRDGWDRDEREALDALGDEFEALRARHASDPPPALLRAAGAEVLPEPLQASTAEHLAKSQWSRTLVAGFDDADPILSIEDQERMLAGIRKQARAARGPDRSWMLLWRPAFAAAALAAVTALAWITLTSNRGPSPATPESTLAVVRPPEVPPVELAVDKPDIKLSASVLTWRGAANENPFMVNSRAAFDAYQRNDYSTAAREFSVLQSRYPVSIEVSFYLGVSRLLLGDAAGAIAALEQAERLGDSAFNDDVAWYRALAEHRAGRAGDAEARLDALCRQAGPRAAMACAAVERLRAAPRPK